MHSALITDFLLTFWSQIRKFYDEKDHYEKSSEYLEFDLFVIYSAKHWSDHTQSTLLKSLVEHTAHAWQEVPRDAIAASMSIQLSISLTAFIILWLVCVWPFSPIVRLQSKMSVKWDDTLLTNYTCILSTRLLARYGQ